MKKIRSFRFTLIEILAVIAIIGILGAIGFGTYSYANTAARESATRAILTQLAAGLEQVKNELGYYPPSGGSWEVVKLKVDDGKLKVAFKGGTPKECRVSKILAKRLDMGQLEKHLDGDDQLCDAWGNAIYYCSPGKINSDFDLVSAGENGKFGSSSSDSPQNARGSYVDKTGEWACDDLANFQ